MKLNGWLMVLALTAAVASADDNLPPVRKADVAGNRPVVNRSSILDRDLIRSKSDVLSTQRGRDTAPLRTGPMVKGSKNNTDPVILPKQTGKMTPIKPAGTP